MKLGFLTFSLLLTSTNAFARQSVQTPWGPEILTIPQSRPLSVKGTTGKVILTSANGATRATFQETGTNTKINFLSSCENWIASSGNPKYEGLSFLVHNPSSKPITVASGLFYTNPPVADPNTQKYNSFAVDLPAGATAQVVAPFFLDSVAPGMHAPLAFPYEVFMKRSQNYAVKEQSVCQLSIYVKDPSGSGGELVIEFLGMGVFTAMDSDTFNTDISDGFGQFTVTDWPAKIKYESDLQMHLRVERAKNFGAIRPIPQTTVISRLQSSNDLVAVSAIDSSIRITGQMVGPSGASTAAAVTFNPQSQPVEWSALWLNRYTVPPPIKDWSGYDGVSFFVGNPENKDIRIGFAIFHGYPFELEQNYTSFGAVIPAGTSKQVVVPFKALNLPNALISEKGNGLISLDKLRSVLQAAFYLVGDEGVKRTVYVSSFGLFTQEDVVAFNNPLDPYGGIGDAVMPASDSFRTYLDGSHRWWLVTPSGRRFISIGLDSVRNDTTEHQFTDVSSPRKQVMFIGLPSTSDPLAENYTYYDDIKAFSFYAANLQRKFGFFEPPLPRDPDVPVYDKYYLGWTKFTLDRLISWGFNTLGSYSTEVLFDKTTSEGARLPYTTNITTFFPKLENPCAGAGVICKGLDLAEAKITVDPFDKNWQDSLDGIMGEATLYKNDPFHMGYFVDNELHFAIGNNKPEDYNRLQIGYAALRSDCHQPAKIEMQRLLKTYKYPNINDLNAAWGTHYSSYGGCVENGGQADNFLNTVHKPASLTASQKSFFEWFVKYFSDEYFKRVNAALKKYDPKHLYLGVHFAYSWYNLESIESCGQYCDVISFNIYQTGSQLSSGFWDFFNTLRNKKPVLIAEYSFSAPTLDGTRRLFEGHASATESQAARGQAYVDYVNAVLGHPAMVGAHFFKYVDQPITAGVSTRENNNFGLVSITDDPYYDAIARIAPANIGWSKKRKP